MRMMRTKIRAMLFSTNRFGFVHRHLCNEAVVPCCRARARLLRAILYRHGRKEWNQARA